MEKLSVVIKQSARDLYYLGLLRVNAKTLEEIESI